MTEMTPQQAAADLRRASASMDKLAAGPIERGAKAARADAIRSLRGDGVGRRVFNDREPAIDVKVATDGNAVEIASYGMAALIERGQRTKRHRIEPKNGSRILVLRTGGRVSFVQGGVDHPGGAVRKKDALEQGIDDQVEKITRDLADVAGRALGAD